MEAIEKLIEVLEKTSGVAASVEQLIVGIAELIGRGPVHAMAAASQLVAQKDRIVGAVVSMPTPEAPSAPTPETPTTSA
jgi:hypothetical protein